MVTWDDSEPARLVGLSYIIGDFTGILSGIVLRHVVEGEHLHVRAVNARTLQSTQAYLDMSTHKTLIRHPDSSRGASGSHHQDLSAHEGGNTVISS